MKTKYVCLAGVNRLVDYAMQSGASMVTLSQWLNDPRDLEPIEMERYYVTICVSDALRDAVNGDLQEVQRYRNDRRRTFRRMPLFWKDMPQRF